MASRVLQSVVDTEKAFMTEVAQDDARGLAMWDKNQSQAVEWLTDRAEKRADGFVKKWLAFYQQLFMEHMDGLSPKAEQQGYAPDWYARVAKETGDRYRDVTQDESCPHNERKMSLLNRASRAVSRVAVKDKATVV